MARIKWFSAVRAYGLFLVLGYHLFYDYFPGGFLGVDIFFTFSGFLITAIVIDEMKFNNGFAVFRFFKRRAQRIIIPLFFSIMFSLPLMLMISPDFSVGIVKQVAAALGFVTNWFQIRSGGSYEAQLLPFVYIHTWSLAIEMQFYLVWGLVCALVSAISKAVSNGDNEKLLKCFKALILTVSAALVIMSYFYMSRIYYSGYSLDSIYFNTFARFFPFFIGAFAASVWNFYGKSAPEPNKKITASLISLTAAAAGAIVYISVSYKFMDEFIFRYGFLITSLLTVVIILCTYKIHRRTPAHINEPRLLKAVSDMSYNAYLIHWPLYVLFTALIMNHFFASVITLVFTFAYAAFIFYGAERIFIGKGKGLRYRTETIAVVSVSLVFSLIASVVVISRAPEITSIEADFAANYVMQDANTVISFERRIRTINESPVIYIELEQNLLAVPAFTLVLPENPPEATPTPAPDETPQPSPSPSPTPSATPRPVLRVTDSNRAGDILEGVTVIGDSVALGAQSTIVRTIPDSYVDALVSRPVNAGRGIMMDLIDTGELREYVVIALGANATYSYEELFLQLIEDIPPGHRVIFVTPFDGRANNNAAIITDTANWMRGLPDMYDYITIADWNAIIAPQANLLAGDRVHMGGQTSMNIYTDMLIDAINEAALKPAKA